MLASSPQEARMPRLVGITERMDQILYSAWIADTRPGGIGVSNETRFRNPMRLFMTDIGDQRRMSFRQAGELGFDRTASIRKIGFHVSFSDSHDFDQVFNYHNGVSFEVNIGGEPVHRIDTVQGRRISPTHSYGIRRLEQLGEPIEIPKRHNFFVELSSDKDVEKRMHLIESGEVKEYAEFKSILDVTMTREVH
jgi:hypothetical protein